MFKNSAGDTRAMRQTLVVTELIKGTDRSGLLVVRAVDDATDARLGESASAHGAGLKRDVECARIEPPCAQRLRGASKRKKLGVGQRVMVDDPAVMPASDDLAIEHHHGANGDVGVALGLARLLKGDTHPLLVFMRHQYTRQDSNLKPSVP